MNLDKISWYYADAMEVEYNRRKQQQAVEDISQDVGLFLNTSNSMELEWQPDWSVAPEWANWWAIDFDMETAFWYELKPIQCEDRWYFDYDGNKLEGETIETPSFNYQGDWKDSLRKRP